MGVMRRIGDLVNRVHDASDLSGVAARINRRREAPVRRLLDTGTPGIATITGMRVRTRTDGGDGHETRLTLRLEWETPLGPRVGATDITGAGAMSPALRLGLGIPVRYDDEHVVIDHPLAPGTGIAPAPVPPEPGIDDRWGRARDATRGEHASASVVSVTRGTVPLLGMPADRWEIALDLADGRRVTHGPEDVPPYARHYICPGARVPVVITGDSAHIRWHALATLRAADPGRVDDPPPAGSIAASLGRSPSRPAAATPGENRSPAAVDAGDRDGHVEGVSLADYARVQAALRAARVAPGEYDAFAAERFGTPPGRWAQIDAQWQRRMLADWRVGAAYAEAFEAARRAR